MIGSEAIRGAAGILDPDGGWPDLAGRLTRVVRRVAKFLKMELLAPTRTEAKERLEKLSRAAQVLATELRDPVILALLTNAKSELMASQLRDDDAFLSQILDLGARAKAASGAVRVGGGRDALTSHREGVSTDSISARDYCAILAFEAWIFVRGKAPGRNNQNAAAMAGFLWQAAGAPPSKGENGTSWSRDMRLARDTSPPPDALPGHGGLVSRAGLHIDVRMMLRTPL
jgi:hypothetical protein